MNNLSQECIEQIEKEVNLKWDGYPHYKKLEVKDNMIAALTNPAIYQSACLMTIEEALRFAEWVQYECIRHEGDWVLDKQLYTTTELLTIFRNQNQEK